MSPITIIVLNIFARFTPDGTALQSVYEAFRFTESYGVTHHVPKVMVNFDKIKSIITLTLIQYEYHEHIPDIHQHPKLITTYYICLNKM